MKKRGDACHCIHRFLSALQHAMYEDELCQVRRFHDAAVAYAYEAANGTKHKIDECIMKIW